MPTIEIIPDLRQIIIQMISLIFLFFMFKRYGWKPTKAFLAKRQEMVTKQFKEAEEFKEEAMHLKQTYEHHMLQVEEEGQRLVEASIDQGKKAYDNLLSDARQEAEQKLALAAVAIEQNRKVAHAKIKGEIIDLTISGVEQIIKKEVDAQVHQQLFEDFIAKVGDQHGES